MSIRKATHSDREAIYKIWLSCFTDDQVYINNYLDYCFPHTTTLIKEVSNSDAVAVISIIPSYFIHEKRIYSGAYLYGVGTLPEHRGKSYSSELISEAVSLLRAKGEEYFLVKPATESLFSLYRRLGFEKELFKSISTLSHFPNTQNNQEINIERIDPNAHIEEIATIREKKMSDKTFMWNRDVLNYALNEIVGRGGSVLFNRYTSDYCTGYQPETSSALHILESTLAPDETSAVFRNTILSTIPGTDEIILDSNYSSNQKGDKILSALLMELKPGIFSFCKDLSLSLPME